MPRRIALIPGDGARREITKATVRVIQAIGIQFNRDVKEASIAAAEEHGFVARISGLDEQGRIGRSSEDFDLPLKTMSGLPNRHCAETA